MKKIVVIPIIAAIAVIGGYYASPLFVKAEMNEPLPEMMRIYTPKMMSSGSFVGVGDGMHNAEGMAKVLAVNVDQIQHRILRLENFKVTNGPDLYVYLSKDPTGINSGVINLGRLKGNIGNQNYNITPDVNLDEYSHVLIWDKQSSVLFGHTDLKVA